MYSSVQFSSVAQSCPTLCSPMDCSTPGLPVHHQLLEFTQTHVRWVGDAIQPCRPLINLLLTMSVICKMKKCRILVLEVPGGKLSSDSYWVYTRYLELICMLEIQQRGTPWRFRGKESACNAGGTGDPSLIPGSGRPPGEGHDNPLQHSCPEAPMDEEPVGS